MKEKEDQFIYWRELLLLMHNLDINGLYFDNKNNLLKNKKYDLIKKELNFNDAEIERAVRKLRKLGYLEPSIYDKKGENLKSFISKEGIEIALRLQEHEDNKKFRNTQKNQNLVLCILTGFLVLTGLFEMYHYVYPEISGIQMVYGVTFLILIWGAIVSYMTHFFLKNN